jgi:hypothetical protein
MLDNVTETRILKNLKSKTSVQQIEASSMQTIPHLKLFKKSVPFGYRNKDWKWFIHHLQPSDELWNYECEDALGTESGYAIIRNKSAVVHFVTGSIRVDPENEGLQAERTTIVARKSSHFSPQRRAEPNNPHILSLIGDISPEIKIVALWNTCAKNYCEDKPLRLGEATTVDYWFGVISLFRDTVFSLDTLPESEIEQFDNRANVWLDFLANVVLPHRRHFKILEMEGIGEFMALAVVMGLKTAILSNPERTALVYDLLPKDVLDSAGLGEVMFDNLFRKTTGRPRIRKSGFDGVSQ